MLIVKISIKVTSIEILQSR